MQTAAVKPGASFCARTEVKVTAADGFDLDATLYEPQFDNGVAIQINSAASTPRRYYGAFAEFMAKLGFAVLVYDYRGAVSYPGRLARRSPASLLAWGGQDQAAMTRWLRARYPARALALLGHSMGGQIVGLSPAARELAAVLLMGSGDGYWRKIPNPKRRRRRAFHVYVSGPLALGLFGYLPGFAMGGGASKGPVHAREFLRFSRSPHFFCDADGSPVRPFNLDVRAPLKQILIADDEVVAPGGELSARAYYPNAVVEIENLRPAGYGLQAIGHFGFFRRSMPEQAWRDVATWLEQACRAAKSMSV